MKALVIGGTGPTGPFVVEGLINRGYEVAIFHRGTHEIELPESVEHIHGDPHFVETLEQILGRRTFDLVISMYGRLRYVAQVMKGRTSRFIGVGGLPYVVLMTGAMSPQGVPILIPETSPVFTKAEQNKFMYLMALSEQTVMEAHQQGHYIATMLRYPIIYGPRQLAPKEWSIIRRILDGRRQLIIPDEGLRLERRAYAENAAHSLLLAVDKPEVSAGQIYNVGDEKILSLREWIQIVASTLNHELELVSMPFSLAEASRPYVESSHHLVMDITKIKAKLGYKDVVPAEEAIQRTVNWYLNDPPPRGGELEQRLGDPFDYTTEERIIKEYKETVSKLVGLASVGYEWRHFYDHPTAPSTTAGD
jgi:nucleoside-diphosphate-sugar epimerase